MISPSPVKAHRAFTIQNYGDTCFFCEDSECHAVLHKASTFAFDSRVRRYAIELNDTRLLAKLAGSDMYRWDFM